MSLKKEEGKMRTLSGRVFNCQGKNLRIHIPLTNPSRTFSAITYLLWDDLINQSSKKCGPEGHRLHINRTKLHHAEKMIRGAFIELYKGLGYLKTYRFHYQAFSSFLKYFCKLKILFFALFLEFRILKMILFQFKSLIHFFYYKRLENIIN